MENGNVLGLGLMVSFYVLGLLWPRVGVRVRANGFRG